MKRCKHCGVQIIATNGVKRYDVASGDGFRPTCRACDAERRKASRKPEARPRMSLFEAARQMGSVTVSPTPLVAPPSSLVRFGIIPDVHHPNGHSQAYSLMLRAMQAFQPEGLVVLGDFADADSLSAHPRTQKGADDFKGEVDSVCKELDILERLKPSAGWRFKKYIEGNHEWRLQRYLARNAQALMGMLNIQQCFGLHERGWEFTPYMQHTSIGKVNFTHDTGTAGMNAHRQARDVFMGSAVIGHCVPLDYEVLTRTGFVKLRHIAEGAEVLGYRDGQVVFTRVNQKVQWKYTGELVTFDNQVISQKMTSEHHLFTKDGKYVPVQDALKSLTKSDLVRFAAPMHATEYPVTDAMLKLVVAYAADGHQASPGSVRFHFKKQRKVERLTMLWEAAGGSISWGVQKSGSVKTTGLDRRTQLELIELCPEKRLPGWLLQLSARQRQLVVEELEHWDGSVIRHDGVDAGIRQFCSHKSAEVSLVQMLLIQHGIRSQLFSDGTVVGYDLNQHLKSVDGERELGYFAGRESVTELEVGCVSTDLQNFFIRTSEGSVELTGNTHRLAYEIRGVWGGPPVVTAMFGWLGDATKITYVHQAQAAMWPLGFGLGYWDTASDLVYLVPVPVVNGTCLVEGKLIR